jgi:hypothetical protein
MTMHDLFKLPVLDNAADDEFTSNVDKHPQRQELLNECAILFIDEAFNLNLGNLRERSHRSSPNNRQHGSRGSEQNDRVYWRQKTNPPNSEGRGIR